ncbi:MAG: CPBP family glutamic-type intramembrane protease [Planctomycetota bacterium]
MNRCIGKTNHPIVESLGLFTISIILVLTIGAYVQMNSIIPGLIVTESLLILLPVFCFVRLKKLEFAKAGRLQKISLGITVRSALLGISAGGIATLLYWFSEKIIGPSPSDSWDTILYPVSISELPIALFVIAVLPGFCEEVLFRGAIQSLLEGKGFWKGLLYTSLLFAIFHFNLRGILSIFFLGFILGMITIRTNSITSANSSVFLHAGKHLNPSPNQRR